MEGCAKRLYTVHSPLPLRLLVQTFHSIPCLECHVDAMDVTGENHIDIDHDMWKQRLGPDGSPIGEAFTEVVSFAASTRRILYGKTSFGACFRAWKR